VVRRQGALDCCPKLEAKQVRVGAAEVLGTVRITERGGLQAPPSCPPEKIEKLNKVGPSGLENLAKANDAIRAGVEEFEAFPVTPEPSGEA